MSEVPFEVVDEVAVGDLTSVQQEILPAAQGVRVRIDKASVATNQTKDLKTLKTELAIVEGIEVVNADTGESELKFVGKKVFPGFMDLCIWANPETRGGNWFKTKQHLLGFKAFCNALELDLANIVVNDEFCQGLIGREMLVNIVHQEDTVKDEHGKRQKTGTISERITGFKKAV